jgi:hypothetical protein
MSENKNTADDRVAQTVVALMNDGRVPFGVRHWLELYAAQGDDALQLFNTALDPSTERIGRLVYDVLSTESQEVGTHEFPEAARDYIQEFLYTLAHASNIQVWTYADVAIAALPIMLDCAAGDMLIDSAEVAALEIAVQALTTKRERGYFIRGLQEERRDEAKEDRDYLAAMKLSRLFANPNTPAKTLTQLGALLAELFNETDMHIDHPAIVGRMAEVIFENVKTPGAVGLYAQLHALLESLPEENGEE